MLEITAFIVIFILYICPLNLYFYNLAIQTSTSIQKTENSLAAFFYVLYTVILFVIIYLVLKHIVVKYMYVYLDSEIEEGSILIKYGGGQRNINAIANTSIVFILFVHLLLGVFDVKILVLGLLCTIFIFKKKKIKKLKKKNTVENNNIEEHAETSGEGRIFYWNYNRDPFGMQRPTSFIIRIPINMDTYKKYQNREHSDISPKVLRELVLEGLCPEIIDVAAQIKKICTTQGFNIFHQTSAVMAFQQSLKYVEYKNSKGRDKGLRYPLETIVDGKGDCYSHGICSAAILYAMGYEVVLLKIIFPEEEGRLAIAVEGANGIPGNFFKYNNNSYYYCEITPVDKNNGSMVFKVGEMPDMPGANITAIPLKEIVSKL